VANQTTENEIKKAEQYEALKQTLLRLLDDPQVQQKIVSLLLCRFGTDLRDKGSRADRHNRLSDISSAC
jgi:hypothetical protein